MKCGNISSLGVYSTYPFMLRLFPIASIKGIFTAYELCPHSNSDLTSRQICLLVPESKPFFAIIKKTNRPSVFLAFSSNGLSRHKITPLGGHWPQSNSGLSFPLRRLAYLFNNAINSSPVIVSFSNK